jgi:protein tyrosine phosphatase (PTP) superfamily phosphohydrolase (DUF442 family)
MNDLPDVINWRRLSDQITTSGQPTEAQLARIKALGVTQIVNLGPHTHKCALPDETASTAALDLSYTYIPVDFENPTQSDFDAFCAVLNRLEGKTIHVHCIYNARVSAFFYRHALEVKGGDKAAMFANMDGIWRPGGVWADFISQPKEASLPNRYAGEDY